MHLRLCACRMFLEKNKKKNIEKNEPYNVSNDSTSHQHSVRNLNSWQFENCLLHTQTNFSLDDPMLPLTHRNCFDASWPWQTNNPLTGRVSPFTYKKTIRKIKWDRKIFNCYFCGERPYFGNSVAKGQNYSKQYIFLTIHMCGNNYSFCSPKFKLIY
jgi:hypothetical protein